ncbi:iron reductase domain protein [Zopfia rhizophila CBS 207.26]|uniref:Iron reductase domain protein n=1 Tax=Zopfia rhizophila CBS 207.26 TaxID=1314779 RepID=A0A6A6E6Q7_9PEZI|nr:iron reductase domain protein [Zopfia rhizophila CBS 207.26]
MRTVELVGSAAALASAVHAQAQSVKYHDSVTGIDFQTYSSPENGASFSIALPEKVDAAYDAILQIVSPKTNPWLGFAWGGHMIFNPLTVTWTNGNNVVHSSRYGTGLGLPQPYDGATYTLLKGSGTNATHFTVTLLIKGVTRWQDGEGNDVGLNGTGTAEFAWAKGGSAVNEPANNQSSFNIHQEYGKWTHDLNGARSSKFATWAAQVAVAPAPGASSQAPAPSSAAPSQPATTAPAKAAIPSSCPNGASPAFQNRLATGWKAVKVVGGLSAPRSIEFDTAGNMLVVQAGKGISIHGMNADGCVTSTKMLISQTNLNHGIAFSKDGKTLYASSANQVYKWTYDATAGAISGSSSVVVKGMFTGIHTTRTLAMHPSKNFLMVSHGSAENTDQPTINPKTGRSVVRGFDMDKVPSGGYNWVNDGWLVGYGMRNDVGITFDLNEHLWGVENSGDQFTRRVNNQNTDIHIDNPAEELHYIGDATKENTKWFGYPTCFTVWEPSVIRDATFKVGDQFLLQPNTTFKDADCAAKSVPASLGFQAHSAPIDLKFDAENKNLYITFHGSWNRQPTTGFKLINVPFTKGADGNYRPVADVSSNKGFEDIMWNPDVTGCVGNGPAMSSGCFRPAGLNFDKSGRLYMTSDTQSNAEIYVLGK